MSETSLALKCLDYIGDLIGSNPSLEASLFTRDFFRNVVDSYSK